MEDLQPVEFKTNKKIEFIQQNAPEIQKKRTWAECQFQVGHPKYEGQGKHGIYLRSRFSKLLDQPVTQKQFNKIKNKITSEAISTQEDCLLAGILHIANYSKSERNKMQAFELISDRCYGKPEQKVISKNLNLEANLDDIDDSELSDRLAKLESQIQETTSRIAETETKSSEASGSETLQV